MRKLYTLPATAAVLALAAPVGIASAQEDEPDYPRTTVEIIEEACGQATIVYNNPTEWDFTGSYRTPASEGTGDEVSGQEIAEGPRAGEIFRDLFNPVEVPAGDIRVVTLTEAELGAGEGGSVALRAWVDRGPEQRSFATDATAEIDTDCGGQDDGQGDGGQDGGQDDADQGDNGSGSGGQDDADNDSGDGSTDPDAVRPGGSYPVGGVETGGGPA